MLLLEVQHVAQFAFVGSAPLDAVGRHTTELRGDAHAGSRPHDCSRHDAVDRQLTADLGKTLAVCRYCSAVVREITSKPSTCARCTVRASVTLSTK